MGSVIFAFTLIIGLFTLIATYAEIDMYRIRLTSNYAPILSILGLIITIVLGYWSYHEAHSPNRYQDTQTTYKLVALSNNKGLSGHLFMGSGNIETKPTIQYMFLPHPDQPNITQLASIFSDELTYVIQTDEITPSLVTTYTYDNFYGGCRSVKHEFYVPKGSVVSIYSIDVSKP